MGAPKGNCNACKGGSRKSSPTKWVGGKRVGFKKMKAKGWYKRSGGRQILKTIKKLSFE